MQTVKVYHHRYFSKLDIFTFRGHDIQAPATAGLNHLSWCLLDYKYLKLRKCIQTLKLVFALFGKLCFMHCLQKDHQWDTQMHSMTMNTTNVF